MIYAAAKRVLFRLDAEKANDIINEQMMRVQSHPILQGGVKRLFATPAMAVERFGLRFRNPLGIAAGFDKNARLIPFLAALGFGFVEVGTVTLRPQPGNPRPRLFRDPASKALINRLGFNNEGATVVSRTLADLWKRSDNATLPPLFVNIGKNRDVALSDAVASYRECYRLVAPYADGVVVNVSSPNTPGMRDLKKRESLREILDAHREEREHVTPPREGRHPILVKIAPDLDDEQLRDVAATCLGGADAMSATNTTVGREGWSAQPEQGGLSGKPLFPRSTEVLRRLRSLVGPDYPLIGVGGIFNADDVRTKQQAGADLVQAYTGFVYEGPAFASRIVRELKRND
jgi:dihydroorotate dehydrogenase